MPGRNPNVPLATSVRANVSLFSTYSSRIVPRSTASAASRGRPAATTRTTSAGVVSVGAGESGNGTRSSPATSNGRSTTVCGRHSRLQERRPGGFAVAALLRPPDEAAVRTSTGGSSALARRPREGRSGTTRTGRAPRMRDRAERAGHRVRVACGATLVAPASRPRCSAAAAGTRILRGAGVRHARLRRLHPRRSDRRTSAGRALGGARRAGLGSALRAAVRDPDDAPSGSWRGRSCARQGSRRPSSRLPARHRSPRRAPDSAHAALRALARRPRDRPRCARRQTSRGPERGRGRRGSAQFQPCRPRPRLRRRKRAPGHPPPPPTSAPPASTSSRAGRCRPCCAAFSIGASSCSTSSAWRSASTSRSSLRQVVYGEEEIFWSLLWTQESDWLKFLVPITVLVFLQAGLYGPASGAPVPAGWWRRSSPWP